MWSAYKEEGFVLAHNFGGFSPQFLGPLAAQQEDVVKEVLTSWQ
jgi:hypothetical protein